MNYLYRNEKLLYLSAFILLIFASINPFSVIAQTSDPVWLSLKYNKTYLRSGPSKQNKVLWTYKQKGLPIKVKRKKGDWYEVEMPEKINGWINWYSWNTDEILRFISAFDHPYVGASSMINNKRIYIKNAHLVKKSKFHPFQNGLICKINNKTYNLGQEFTMGVANPESKKYSGNIIYVDNRPPVTRSTTQKEDVKIILQF